MGGMEDRGNNSQTGRTNGDTPSLAEEAQKLVQGLEHDTARHRDGLMKALRARVEEVLFIDAGLAGIKEELEKLEPSVKKALELSEGLSAAGVQGTRADQVKDLLDRVQGMKTNQTELSSRREEMLEDGDLATAYRATVRLKDLESRLTANELPDLAPAVAQNILSREMFDRHLEEYSTNWDKRIDENEKHLRYVCKERKLDKIAGKVVEAADAALEEGRARIGRRFADLHAKPTITAEEEAGYLGSCREYARIEQELMANFTERLEAIKLPGLGFGDRRKPLRQGFHSNLGTRRDDEKYLPLLIGDFGITWLKFEKCEREKAALIARVQVILTEVEQAEEGYRNIFGQPSFLIGRLAESFSTLLRGQLSDQVSAFDLRSRGSEHQRGALVGMVDITAHAFRALRERERQRPARERRGY